MENIPNVRAIANSLSHSPAVRQQLLSHAINCVKPGLESNQVWSQTRSGVKPGLESNQVWSQTRSGVKPGLESNQVWSIFRGNYKRVSKLHWRPSRWQGCSLLTSSHCYALKVELPVYSAKADGVDAGTDCLKWWGEYEPTLPN